MSLSSNATFTVADQAAATDIIHAVVQPPLGYGTGGKGRLTHPTLGVYDYVHPPTHTVNIDGDVCFPPEWAHSKTLGGGVDVLWPGYVRDVIVTERWAEGEVGSVIEHLRMLWYFLSNPPDPSLNSFVVWTPNYATDRTYNVALISVVAGDAEYTLDRRLASWGYAPQPVELKMRVLDYASA